LVVPSVAAAEQGCGGLAFAAAASGFAAGAVLLAV